MGDIGRSRLGAPTEWTNRRERGELEMPSTSEVSPGQDAGVVASQMQ